MNCSVNWVFTPTISCIYRILIYLSVVCAVVVYVLWIILTLGGCFNCWVIMNYLSKSNYCQVFHWNVLLI